MKLKLEMKINFRKCKSIMKSEIERASHAECDALNAFRSAKRCIKLHKVVYHIHYRV